MFDDFFKHKNSDSCGALVSLCAMDQIESLGVLLVTITTTGTTRNKVVTTHKKTTRNAMRCNDNVFG